MSPLALAFTPRDFPIQESFYGSRQQFIWTHGYPPLNPELEAMRHLCACILIGLESGSTTLLNSKKMSFW